MNHLTTFSLLLSNPGTTNGFHAPCENCCNPILGPESGNPTHSEPSGPDARAVTPGAPTFDLSSLGKYAWNEPGLQPVRLLLPPSQKFPAKPRVNTEDRSSGRRSAVPSQRVPRAVT